MVAGSILFCRENFIKKQPLMAFYTPFDTKQAKNANIVVSAQTFLQFAYKILSLTLFLCYFHGCLLAIVFCRENFIKKQPLMAFDTPFDTKQAKNANIVVSAETFLCNSHTKILSLTLFLCYFHGCSILFVVKISSKNNL